jgi:molecular chaperone HtpG
VQRLQFEETNDDWSNILFDQAMLAEGGALTDPAAFVKRLNALLLEMAGK